MELQFLESATREVRLLAAGTASCVLFAFLLRLTAPFPNPWRWVFSAAVALALPAGWFLGLGLTSSNPFFRTLFSDIGFLCMVSFPISIFLILRIAGVVKGMLTVGAVAALLALAYLFLRR